jgi:prepilin-type N-terminal cleavage/methylation domain-containing protein
MLMMRDFKKTVVRRGFTMIELMVSVGLFTIVVTITMSAYLRIIALDRVARSNNDVVTNLSYVVDAMTRGIRTGTAYQCGDGSGALLGDCWHSPGNSFSFKNDQGVVVDYVLMPVAGGKYAIGECTGSALQFCLTNGPTPVTDPRIDVQSFNFYLRSTVTGADLQPQVLFTIKGTVTPDATLAPIPFYIQSSATMRFLNL